MVQTFDKFCAHAHSKYTLDASVGRLRAVATIHITLSFNTQCLHLSLLSNYHFYRTNESANRPKKNIVCQEFFSGNSNEDWVLAPTGNLARATNS